MPLWTICTGTFSRISIPIKVVPSIEVGSRVFSRAVGQDGVVVREFGSGMVTVRFPTGERTLEIKSLQLRETDALRLLTSLTTHAESEGDWYDIRLRSANLQAAYGSDNLSGLASSRVILRPHQIFVAHRILEKPRPSMLVADEVGLGKTVEAGLVLKELIARKSVDRILIITPPNLLNQWHTEMRIKFNETFEIIDSPVLNRERNLYPNSNPWSRFNRVLVSSYLARTEDQRADLVGAGWDLVILDEGHHCRRKRVGKRTDTTELYRTMDLLKDSSFGVMVLTATPMQLHPFELFSLVEIVEPGLYESYEDFEQEAAASQELRRTVATLQAWDDSTQEAQNAARLALQSQGLSFASDSPVDRERVIERLLEIVRLTQAIVRNRKRTVGGFTRRRARTSRVDLSPEEVAVNEQLLKYLKEGYAIAARSGDRLLGFEMVTFQRLLASSSRALSRALTNRKARLLGEASRLQVFEDDDEQDGAPHRIHQFPDEPAVLDSLIASLSSISDSKVNALVRLIDQLLDRNPDEKVLVFTQFLATQDLICERLARHRVVHFRGAMNRWEKDAAVARFRQDAQVMVSTEAGGEGRNFQFCHILVNFDLHWNPMKIEQRIGRLDRYGQTKNVQIYNITSTATIEDRLLQVLLRRLNLFEETVGALELVLGDVEDDVRSALVQASGDVDEAAAIFERAIELRIQDAQRVDEKSADFLIELGSFQKDIANRLTDDLREGRERIELERLVLDLIQYFPTAQVQVDREVYSVAVPPALGNTVGARLETDYVGTFDAATAVQNEQLDFFGFGHPLIDACLSYASSEASEGLVSARVLPADLLDAPIVVTNYVLEFNGIRKWASVESMAFDFSGKRVTSVEGHLNNSEPGRKVGTLVTPAIVEAIRDASIRELTAIAEAERPARIEQNLKHVAAEERRAERIHRYNVRRVAERKSVLEAQIAASEDAGSPEQRQIIPALRGQVRAREAELADLDRQLEAKLAEIEASSTVTPSFRLVNAALVVPASMG
jgi:ERCC4-related helicase